MDSKSVIQAWVRTSVSPPLVSNHIIGHTACAHGQSVMLWASLRDSNINNKSCRQLLCALTVYKMKFRLGKWGDSISMARQHCFLKIMFQSSSAEKKDVRVLMDIKLSVSHPCAFTAKVSNGVLDCIRLTVAKRLREVTIPHYSVLTRPQLELLGPVLGCTVQERPGHIGQSPAMGCEDN